MMADDNDQLDVDDRLDIDVAKRDAASRAVSLGQTASRERLPLDDLATVIASCSLRGITPVIQCDGAFTLRDEFYRELCRSVRALTGCDVHLDLMPRHRLDRSLMAFTRPRALRRLSERLRGLASVADTMVLSRSRVSSSQIVIGFAGNQDEIPSYAKPIELAA